MTLTQLYYFKAAAQGLNFHKTAETLMISQPSLSASIAALERELGVRLFQRRGRHVELTRQGLIYQKELEVILTRLDAVNSLLRRARTPGQGHIDLGYIAALSPKFVPETVRAFLQKKEYAQVSFGFQELPTRELIEQITDRRLDIAFCIYEESQPGIEFVPILIQELAAIVPLDNPLAKEESIHIQQLAPFPFISYMPHTKIYHDIMKYIQESGWTPNTICDATSEAGIVGLVAHGFGVSIVARSGEFEHSKVKILPLQNHKYQRTIYMAYRKDEELLPDLDSFIQFVKQETSISGMQRV